MGRCSRNEHVCSFPGLQPFRPLFRPAQSFSCNGNVQASTMLDKMRYAGQRGSSRSWAEAAELGNQISSLERTSIDSAWTWLKEKTASHIVPRGETRTSLRAAGNAANVSRLEKLPVNTTLTCAVWPGFKAKL